MTDRRPGVMEEEPMGIVISRGSRAEVTPRVSAYVWGIFPELESTPIEAKAA